MGIMNTSYVWATFINGLTERVLDIVIFTTADNDNIRVVIPSGEGWIVVNPHATLDHFCEHYSRCNTEVECCNKAHVNETAQQLQVRNKWSTGHLVKVGSKKMTQLLRAVGWACSEALDALNEVKKD